MTKGIARRRRNKMWQRYSNTYGWWADRRTTKRRGQRDAVRFEAKAEHD